jgi:hypothetical protein
MDEDDLAAYCALLAKGEGAERDLLALERARLRSTSTAAAAR